METATENQQWHASYWNDAKHGNAWVKAKDALERDWLQTKADLHANGGQHPHQRLLNTAKQVAGREAISPPDLPNVPFERIEGAISYGLGAREEYGNQYWTWDDALETRLAWEWSSTKTGMKFDDAMPFIRRGWDYRK